jgi:hypothetical protein
VSTCSADSDTSINVASAQHSVSRKRQPDTCHYARIYFKQKKLPGYGRAQLRSKISDHATCFDASRSQSYALLDVTEEHYAATSPEMVSGLTSDSDAALSTASYKSIGKQVREMQEEDPFVEEVAAALKSDKRTLTGVSLAEYAQERNVAYKA